MEEEELEKEKQQQEQQEQQKSQVVKQQAEQAARVATDQAKAALKKAAKEAGKKALVMIKSFILKHPIALAVIGGILLILILIFLLLNITHRGTVSEAAEVMQEDISQYVTIDEGHFTISEELYNIYAEKLEEEGLDGGAYLNKDSQYLKAIIKAELATTYPMLKNEETKLDTNEFQGIVQIIRRSYNAEDEETYYNGGEGDDKELLLEYIDSEEFDQTIDELKESFNQSKYDELRRHYTIGGKYASGSSGGSSGDGGSDAEGDNGITYDSTFATLAKTPEELNLTVDKTVSNVRTTVYGAGAEENGGYAGQTASGIDLEEGRHIVAVGTVSPIAEIGDWVCLKGKPELGYFLVCDTGGGEANFGSSWMDIFDINSDEAQSVYGDYNDVQVIKKEVAEEFIASGFSGGENNSNTTTSNNTSSSTATKIVIPTYNGTSVGTETINYQNNVNKYSVPVEFLISQLNVSSNPEYIYSLADMVVNNSKIELVIQETKTTTTTTTVTNTSTTNSNGETVIQAGTPSSTTKTTYGIMKYIREVDTWIVNVTQKYYKQSNTTTSGSLVYDQAGTFTQTTTEKIEFVGAPGQTNASATTQASNNFGPSLEEDATKGVAQDITDEIKQTMSGKSMVDNSNISYDDLSYLTIPYIDFNGNRQIGHMVVAKDLADEVLSIFEELYNIGYPIEKMEPVDQYYSGTRSDGSDDAGSDYASIDDNNTSAFNYRLSTAGSGNVSQHGLGRAIDINPRINPYVKSDGTGSHPNASKFWDRSDANRATLSEVEQKAFIAPDTEIYRIFTKYGWTWGGSWSSYLDYQHFEKP